MVIKMQKVILVTSVALVLLFSCILNFRVTGNDDRFTEHSPTLNLSRQSDVYVHHVDAIRHLIELHEKGVFEIRNRAILCSAETETEIEKCIEKMRWQSPADREKQRKLWEEYQRRKDAELQKNDTK